MDSNANDSTSNNNVIIDEKNNNEDSQNKKITFRNSFKIKIVIIILTIFSCSFFSYLNYRTSILNTSGNIFDIGSYWTDATLIADYNFAIYKPNVRYRAELQDARDAVSPVFILDSYTEIHLAERIKEIAEDLLVKNDSTIKNYTTAANITNFFNQTEAIQAKEITKLTNQLIPFINKIYSVGYINQQIDKMNINDVLTVRLYPNLEYFAEKALIFDKQKFSISLQKFCSELFNEETNQIIVDIIYKIAQPNLTFSEELTSRKAKLAEQSVKKTVGIVRKGETIINKGERLSEENILKIKSYIDSSIAQEGETYSLLNILGSIGHSSMLYSLLLLFLIIIRKKIWADNYQIILLSIPLIIVSMMGWLSFVFQLTNPNAPIEYLIILPAFSMFIAIIFDSRTAFYSTVTMALMLAGVRGNDYYVGLTMLFTGAIAAYAVKDIQDRTQMFSSIIFIFIGFVLSILAINFERGFDVAVVMPQLLLSLINAITAPVITFALLFGINKYSKVIVTNLKLREYIDKEHPLITEMRTKSSGTFEHTREVANIAEIAAASIGANALLTKVGAMFHDIGKMNKPEFFTENKFEYKFIKNDDQNITPVQSAEIILNHIKMGISRAKAAGLPQQIIDFIPQHHGTTLVKHFYNVALNEAKETGAEVKQSDFRYPGPKPQTKETTILMICDSAEAVSKSTSDMEEFKTIFEAIIEDRIKDGQFDESNITLQDIHKIKEVIYTEIKGKLHTRVQYAKAEKDEEKAAKSEEK
jgi:putative nucleotidyltransferase with HDIG domain